MLRIRPTIVLFGDSLTQQGFGEEDAHGNMGLGWTAMMSSAYCRRADVLNRGFSGYNTRHGIELLPRVFGGKNSSAPSGGGYSDARVLFCTIFFGANDASLPGGKQHVPLEEYVSNLRTMIDSMRDRLKKNEEDSKDTVPIIVMTPPPIDSDRWEKYCLENNRKVTKRSTEACRTYGAAVMKTFGGGNFPGVHVFDVFSALGGERCEEVVGDSGTSTVDNSYRNYLSDGLHLNGLGNKILYEGFMQFIKTELPHLAPMVDGEGRYGDVGVPLEEKLWTEIC